jgi:hypothetical protein
MKCLHLSAFAEYDVTTPTVNSCVRTCLLHVMELKICFKLINDKLLEIALRSGPSLQTEIITLLVTH